MKLQWDTFLPRSVGFEDELKVLASAAQRRIKTAEKALVLEIAKAGKL
jgi:hypothetical protein